MIELHLPWLELVIAMPLVGAAWVWRLREPELAQRDSVIITALTLACTILAWGDFTSLHTFEAHDHWSLPWHATHHEPFVMDELSAPLLPMAALLYFVTAVATLRTKIRRFSFASALASESILMATLSCRHAW